MTPAVVPTAAEYVHSAPSGCVVDVGCYGWTPGALYRLALICRCVPERVCRAVANGGIPVVRMVARKPDDYDDAPPTTRYVSLAGVQKGVQAAWRHTWGDNE